MGTHTLILVRCSRVILLVVQDVDCRAPCCAGGFCSQCHCPSPGHSVWPRPPLVLGLGKNTMEERDNMEGVFVFFFLLWLRSVVSPGRAVLGFWALLAVLQSPLRAASPHYWVEPRKRRLNFCALSSRSSAGAAGVNAVPDA